nr:hypothetical protein [Aulosira sp. DedVER01a]
MFVHSDKLMLRSHIQDLSELMMRSLLLFECKGIGGALTIGVAVGIA